MHSNPPHANPSFALKTQHSQGFSIVEIALALGIVGFAFIALMGLLPAGLTTFRAAIDQTNEGRIMESLTSQTEAAEFNNLAKEFDFPQSNAVFYFDEEGTFIRRGTAAYGGLSPAEKLVALYSVKLFLDPGWNGNPASANSETALVLMVSSSSSGYAQFQSDIDTRPKLKQIMSDGKLSPEIRVRSLITPKMDGQ